VSGSRNPWWMIGGGLCRWSQKKEPSWFHLWHHLPRKAEKINAKWNNTQVKHGFAHRFIKCRHYVGTLIKSDI
jgi:hypothetical protein